MKYFYYPGCSLEGTAREYNASTRAVMGAVGAALMELEDWTCCGASAGDTASGLLAMSSRPGTWRWPNGPESWRICWCRAVPAI